MAIFQKKGQEIRMDAGKKTNPRSKEGVTQLGKNLTINGIISGSDDLDFYGTLEGEFDLHSKLNVEETARVKGAVKAKIIIVKGTVEGTVNAKDRLHLDKTSKLQGQITTPKFSVAEGAEFNGDVKMVK